MLWNVRLMLCSFYHQSLVNFLKICHLALSFLLPRRDFTVFRLFCPNFFVHFWLVELLFSKQTIREKWWDIAKGNPDHMLIHVARAWRQNFVNKLLISYVTGCLGLLAHWSVFSDWFDHLGFKSGWYFNDFLSLLVKPK